MRKIKAIVKTEDGVSVNYTLERSSAFPGPERVNKFFSKEEIYELPLHTGPTTSSQDAYTQRWYEDVHFDKKRGIRFAFSSTEMSDDFFDESVKIYSFAVKS